MIVYQLMKMCGEGGNQHVQDVHDFLKQQCKRSIYGPKLTLQDMLENVARRMAANSLIQSLQSDVPNEGRAVRLKETISVYRWVCVKDFFFKKNI